MKISIHGARSASFHPIDEGAGLFEAVLNFRSGWALRSTLFLAGSGGGIAGGNIAGRNIAVYNPTAGLGNDVHQQIAATGEVRCLIAPNLFHHLGLREWLERYPGAEVFSSQTAAHRINRKSGIRPKPIDSLKARLPGGTRILTPAGLKNGEVWVGLEAGPDRILVVGDAFFSLAGPFRGLSGKILRAMRTGPDLQVPRTWSWLHCRNSQEYGAWFSRATKYWAATVLVPCHGDVVRDSKLGRRLIPLAGRADPD